MTPYLRYVVDLPGETVELYVPEMPESMRVAAHGPMTVYSTGCPTNMVYDCGATPIVEWKPEPQE